MRYNQYRRRRNYNRRVNSAASTPVVETLSYAYDALNRPISRNADTFGYNDRSEVSSANISEFSNAYDYDEIGNLLLSAQNIVTNLYTANNLNQYTSILRDSVSPCEPSYDDDGNLLCDGVFTFTYDAANRLKTVSTNGVLLVTNFYDAKSRRVRKVTPEATTTFFYDDWNLIEERIAYTNGATSTIHYYWGKNLSGTLQGAGGVGGLLYLMVNDSVYIPFYDNNGNITRYLDSTGETVATYTYDAFGNTISQSGSLANIFRHRFSTKYIDSETDLYYYGYRFYHPILMRWLTRDPIEESGGVNLYGVCGNNPVSRYDKDGRAYFALRPLSGMPWLWLASHNIIDDLFNTEIAHEHLFFEDGKEPSNFGLHNNVDDEGSQIFHNENPSKYKHFERGYDDCVMRIAVENVKPKRYSLLGSFRVSKYNCQDYCSDLRREYFRLILINSIRKKCCLRK